MMSEQELKEVLAAIERVRAANSTPEQARRLLEEGGFINEKGELTEPYRRSPNDAA